MLAYIAPKGEAFHLSECCPALNAGRAGAAASGRQLRPLLQVELEALPKHYRPCYECAQGVVVIQPVAAAAPTADAQSLLEAPSLSLQVASPENSAALDSSTDTAPSRHVSPLRASGSAGQVPPAATGETLRPRRSGLSAASIVAAVLAKLGIPALRRPRN
jgi:hypothetical protein